jgi:hypothetical protein
MSKRFLWMAFFVSTGFFYSCSIMKTRPVQKMSDTSAAIRAAREVQADTLAPELFRQANEWFIKARNEYKFKNFDLAEEYIDKARKYAEQAEFESIRAGASRTDANAPSDPMADPMAAPEAAATPYAYPTPTGTPADAYEQRRQEELRASQPPAAPSPQAVPAPLPTQ